ncbi:MAG: HNH endonuclease signature motif containing protein [Candidatus Omnitrophota bacterium]
MPPPYVKTIKEEILYEYAKLVSRSAFKGRINYGFVTDRFKALRDGSATMSGTIREWQREQELDKECVYCGALEGLQTDHLIPRSRGGPDSADNSVLSCPACNASRNDRGVFQWLGLKKKDGLHRLVAGKYLKLLFDLHQTRDTLDINKDDIARLCPECRNKPACKDWDKEQELTCFCLESVF